MKLLILSDASSPHTKKWALSLSQRGIKINLFSFFKPNNEIKKYYEKNKIKIISPNLKSKIKNLREPNITKLKYLGSIPLLLKTLNSFQPNLIHAHYASSYGLLGHLSGFKPNILSVWGSDIYHFPTKNTLNNFLLKKVIKSADLVCSTSIAMKDLIHKNYFREDIKIVPFGIDTNVFKPIQNTKKPFTVGTVKSIEDHNGIDCLIDAAEIVIKDLKKDIYFLIVGDGLLKSKMEEKVSSLNLDHRIEFTGKVRHEDVIDYYNKLSIFIAVSLRESFGVSILEAAACEIPSITSNIGGLAEVNLHNKTGIVIDPNNPFELAKSIAKLHDKEDLRKSFGISARERVENNFNWNDNVNQMIELYRKLCK